MKKKRVLLIHNYYQLGGGEHTVFENEKELLQKNGHEVFTYTRTNDELKKSKWNLIKLPFSMIWSFRTFLEVRRLIRINGIEIVHCHNTFPLISPSVYYAARSLRIPVIQTVHNFRFLCPNGLFFCNGNICEKCKERNDFFCAIKNKCYRNSRLQTIAVVLMLSIHRWIGSYRKLNYIFLTEFNRSKFADLIDINSSTVFIKPNFVFSVEEFEKREISSVKFIYTGRLDENKGILFLLNVWKELPMEYELHIYGDGACKDECIKLSKKYDNIYFHGFCAHEKVFSDLKKSTALIFSSVLYESFGLSWAESFAAGVPVVSANCGNHGAIIQESQGGTVYEVDDKRSFKAAIEEIIVHNDLYSRNAKKYFEQHLDEQNNYKRLIEIYDKAKHIQ